MRFSRIQTRIIDIIHWTVSSILLQRVYTTELEMNVRINLSRDRRSDWDICRNDMSLMRASAKKINKINSVHMLPASCLIGRPFLLVLFSVCFVFVRLYPWIFLIFGRRRPENLFFRFDHHISPDYTHFIEIIIMCMRYVGTSIDKNTHPTDRGIKIELRVRSGVYTKWQRWSDERVLSCAMCVCVTRACTARGYLETGCK